MLDIEWLASYEIGAPEIDHDHRELVDAFRSVQAAFANARYEECRERIGTFAERAAEHLVREEEFLHRVGFPGADDHADHHAELLARIALVRDACASEEEPMVLAGHLDALAAVLMTDLIGGDLEFKAFLHGTELVGSD